MNFFDRLGEALAGRVKEDLNLNDVKSVSVFDRAIQFILDVEGGYVDDLYDKGGKTKYGISQKAYPNLDIYNLTLEQAKEIYFNDYWKGSGEKVVGISGTLAIILFDTAVNMGVGTAIRFLQRVLHVKEDAIFGPQTKDALLISNIEDVIDRYLTLRMIRYSDLEGWSRYRNGWVKRLIKLARYSL